MTGSSTREIFGIDIIDEFLASFGNSFNLAIEMEQENDVQNLLKAELNIKHNGLNDLVCSAVLKTSDVVCTAIKFEGFCKIVLLKVIKVNNIRVSVVLIFFV